MFSFLNSTILFAAAAALIPLLIHLFSKRKVKVVEFPSLKHLKAMQKKQVRRLKIKQLLLLLLRMLIILMVVLAFARPTTESGRLGSHASVSAAIIIDNSASMNQEVTDGNLYDIARRKTLELLDNFEEGDELYLLPLVAPPHKSNRHVPLSSEKAKEHLSRLDCSFEDARLSDMLAQAARLLNEARHINKELYLVTDRQISALGESLSEDTDGLQIFLLDLPLPETANIGVTNLALGSEMILPGHEFSLTTTVKNYGTESSTENIASLYLNDIRVAQRELAVNDGEQKEMIFRVTVNRTGYHTGYVELSDDMFAGDNRYYFSFYIPEQFSVLIIDGDQSGALLELALTPSPELNRYWSVKSATVDQLSTLRFWEYDVIILAGSPLLTDSYMQRLESFLRRGKTIYLTYGADKNINLVNTVYSQLSGVTYQEPVKQQFSRAGYFSFDTFSSEHPIFSIFSFEDNQLPEIKFYTLPKMTTAPGAKTVMSFTGSRPALVEHTYLGGKVLTFTGPVSPEYTDLATSPFFVPFLSRTIEYLAAGLSEQAVPAYCGELLTRPLPDDTDTQRPLEITLPDGSISLQPLQSRNGRPQYILERPPMPGIYTVASGGKLVDRFVINIKPAEADIRVADIQRLQADLQLSNVHYIPYNDVMTASLTEFRYGRELWSLFLWIAAILLLFEMLLARSIKSGE